MEIIPEPEWVELLERLKSSEGIAIILGTTDSGKSTLARFLINNLLADHYRVSYVDSDIGQSSLGLPGTISQKTFYQPEDMNDFRPSKIYFIGSLNPSENIPFMIEGTKRMVKASESETLKMIILDTTGLVTGEIGRALKIGKIRAILPGHVIALQRYHELEPILAIVEGAVIHRLHVSKHVQQRCRERRIKYREKKFREHFKDPFRIEIPLKNVQFFHHGDTFLARERYIKEGSLVGLNRGNNTIALGIFDSMSFDRVAIITPLEDFRDVDRIVVGDIILDQIV